MSASPAALQPPRLTVASLVRDGQGRMLFVEEEIEGRLVLNQPAGRLERGESLVAAAERETLEETGWEIAVEALVGVYQWRDARRHTVRFAFAARPRRHHPGRRLDAAIRRVLWLDDAAFRSHPVPPRSPLVARCLEDFLAGHRLPLEAVLRDLPGGGR
ncbi:MAG: NUDIX domain-containing protein [Xanthomonadales bacterium]|nr:NUDIX domain-containing protein [Xanthomonadales bacterium]